MKILKKIKINEKNDDENYILKEGEHLLTLGGPYKAGRNIKCRKTKYKTKKLPLTVIKNFECGLIKVKIDANLYSFNLGETYYIDIKNTKLIVKKNGKLL